MTRTKHLWAVGYDDTERASQVREEIVRLGWAQNRLLLDDVAVLTKIAAKKTAGVLGDDLALNAQQVVGEPPTGSA